MRKTHATDRGFARRICEHSLAYARSRGFRAMQFNFLGSTTVRALRLWESLGFKMVGRLPAPFRHRTVGDVDAYVMYKLP